MQYSFRRPVTQTVCLSLLTKPQSTRLSSLLLQGLQLDSHNGKIRREAAIHSFQNNFKISNWYTIELPNQSTTSANSRHRTQRRHRRPRNLISLLLSTYCNPWLSLFLVMEKMGPACLCADPKKKVDTSLPGCWCNFALCRTFFRFFGLE